MVEEEKQEVKKEEKREVKPVAPAIKQMIIRDIGKYGGTHGVNKLFHMMSAIDDLMAHLSWTYVIKKFNEKIAEMKKFEEANNLQTLYRKVKDWDNMMKILTDLRPKLGAIEYNYGRMKQTRFKKEIKDKYTLRYEKLCKKVTPYQPEMYFFFNLLMEISGMQTQTITAEAWLTVDTADLIKPRFVKPKRTPFGMEGEGSVS